MLLTLLAAAQAATVPAATAPTAIPLGDVKPLVGTTKALPLAARVLPPAIRGRVVEGRVTRQWLPGQVYWIGFREEGRLVEPDLCERGGHAVQATAPTGAGEAAPPDTPLRVSAVESWTEVAVLPAGARGAATCEAAHYISVRSERPRQIEGYRTLNRMIAAAGGSAPLPFRLTCKAENPSACADARAALATLPLEALHGVNVSCLEEQKTGKQHAPGVVSVRCPALEPGQPYQAQVRFGVSAPDGQSWTASFVQRPGWPETLALSRSTIIYH
jgi:hypothetical protein